MKSFSLSMLIGTGLLWMNTTYAVAAEKTTSPAPTTSVSDSGTAQSDVIGSKEAPGIFNIVPWKEKETRAQKKEVNTSILRETLQPLDRDVLRREIEFHRNTASH